MGVEDIHFWKKTWNFKVCCFSLRNSRQNKAPPLEVPQNCVKPLGNSKAKNKTQFYMNFFLSPPENSLSFLINHLILHRLFLQYLWKFDVLNAPPLPRPPRLPCPCFDFSGKVLHFAHNLHSGFLKSAVFVDEKVLFRQLFLLHSFLGRQDNYLQEILFRRK